MRVIFLLLLTACAFCNAMNSLSPENICNGLFILALAAETQNRYPVIDNNPAQNSHLACSWNGCRYAYDPVLQCIRHMHGPYKSKEPISKNFNPKSHPKKK